MRIQHVGQSLLSAALMLGLCHPVHAQSYAETVLADRPVAYYRLDETAVGVVRDQTDNHIDGDMSGNLALAMPGGIQGDPNPGIGFGQGTVGVGTGGNALSLAGSLTVEAWFNQSSRQEGSWIYAQAIACKANDQNYGFYGLFYGGGSSFVFEIKFDQSGTFGDQIGVSSTPYTTNEWHHIVGTYDASLGIMRLYMDGEVVAEKAVPGYTLTPHGEPLLIGDMPYYPYFPFKGTIDEVAIYNDALSSERVLTHYLKGGGRHVPGISTFRFTPNPVDAPGDQVTAEVFSDEPLTSVSIAGNPLQFRGVAPTRNLVLDNGRWTAIFPTSFLANATTDAVSFTATGTRPDGSRVYATATLSAKTTFDPAIVSVTPSLSNANPGNTLSVTARLLSSTTPSASPALLTLNVPSGVDVVSTTGGQWNAATRALTWSGSTWGSLNKAIAVAVRVPENAPNGTQLLFPARGIVPGKADASDSGTVKVLSGTIPRGIDVDTSRGKNMLTGRTTVAPGQNPPPLTAMLQPWPESHYPFRGRRRSKLWFEVTQIRTEGLATYSVPSDGSLEAGLAANMLIAPSVSPRFDAYFPTIDSAVTISTDFTVTAAEIQVLDRLRALIPGAPSIDAVLSVANDWKKISAVSKAAGHFVPFPRNAYQLGKALVAAGNEFTIGNLSYADRQALVAVAKKLGYTGEDSAELAKIVKGIFASVDFFSLMNDLLYFSYHNISDEWGFPMQVRFKASPLTQD